MENIITSRTSQIQEIRRSKLPKEREEFLVQEVKKQEIQSSTIIFSTLTSMIGTGILVYPLLYKNYGIVLCQLIVTMMCLISYKTATLCIMHCRNDEDDITTVISRLLGQKWNRFYCFTGAINLFMCCIIFYILMANILYNSIEFIYHKAGHSFISKDRMHFESFSFQYCCLINSLVIIIVMQIRNLNLVMKVAEFSFIGIVAFFFFVFTKAIQNAVTLKQSNNINNEEVKIFSKMFGLVAGNCALSYNVHNMIVPIFQQSKNKQNNLRDMKITFGCGFFFYSFIGLMGYLAIYGKQPTNVQIANTFMDYYSTDYFAFITDIFIFIKLFSITPLYLFLGKNQLFELLYKQTPPKYANLIYNILYLIITFLIGIFNYQPSQVMGVNGAYCGFVLLYLSPISIHLACIYKTSCISTIPDADYKSQQYQNNNNHHEENNENFMQDLQLKPLIDSINKNNKFSPCNSQSYLTLNKYLRFTFYFILISIGFILGLFVLINIFKNQS